jgi:hypothetical protein
MQTRSKTISNQDVLSRTVIINNWTQELEVNIDFDDASRLWRSNKKKMANCCYQYVCGFELKSGEFCKKTCSKNSQHCSIHKSKNK